MTKYGVLVHGGAGSLPADVCAVNAMSDAAWAAHGRLIDGGTAVDAVLEAVSGMEDSGSLNAGMGSCLTEAGTVEMDAGIMDGSTMECGGVGAINGVANPVRAAAVVMRESDHSLLTGAGATTFATKHGVAAYTITPDQDQPAKFEEMHENCGTVGAVALDTFGNLAAAVSTGGVRLKLPGRVGDSAVVGAGYYADNHAAAATTGNGDVILQTATSKTACGLVMSGMGAQEAADAAIGQLGELRDGRGGIIVMDEGGNVGISFNTPVMATHATSGRL